MIFPYIGGEEVNTSPTHAHHRYVINFGDMTRERGSRSWPELMAIVEDEGQAGARRSREARQHEREAIGGSIAEPTPELYAAIARVSSGCWSICARQPQSRVCVSCPADRVFAHSRSSFSLSRPSVCLLRSPVSPPRDLGAVLRSSMKDDLRYTPSDCFETFPFPEDWETEPASKPPARPTTSSAPHSWCETTRA